MNKAAAAAPAVDIWKTEKKVSRRKILSIILVFYLWCAPSISLPAVIYYFFTFLSSWIVNIVDGVALITVHALQDNTRHDFFTLYTGIYSYQYIYIVWLLEVSCV